MSLKSYDLIVIGSGPGGEVGAIRAAQLGLRVALIEKRAHLGGTCLNVGCIPTKALLESAKFWKKLQNADKHGFSLIKASFRWDDILGNKDKIIETQRKGLKFLMKKNKVDVYQGLGQFRSEHEIDVISTHDGKTETLFGHHILLATGSEVSQIPNIKVDGKVIHTSDTIINIEKVPQSMLIIGGGVIGLEFASLFSSFSSKVTVVEMMDTVLAGEDRDCVNELLRQFKKKSIKVITGTKVLSVEKKENSCEVELSDETRELFDCILVSIGRKPVIQNLCLEEVGLHTKNGFISSNAHYQTNISHIFAIGDIIQTPALAHTASAEAIHAVETIAGKNPRLINYETNPSAIYTFPEVAGIGRTEESLKADGISYQVAQFPFAPIAKAKIEESTEGFIKIIYSQPYKQILGVHIVGAKATELISEFVLGSVLEATLDDIGHAIHPHPTISESIQEAAHSGLGGPIHL